MTMIEVARSRGKKKLLNSCQRVGMCAYNRVSTGDDSVTRFLQYSF